jgi:hypothetical protein
MSCFPLGLIIYGFLVKKKTNKGTLVERQESKNYDLVWFVIAYITFVHK